MRQDCRRSVPLVAALAGLAGASSAVADEFDYQDFGSTAGLSLTGDAAVEGNAVRLAHAAYDTRGSLWTTDKVGAGAFETKFTFSVNNHGRRKGPVGGADGLGFVVHQFGNTLVSPESGPSGGSFVVEFDTWKNPGELNDNHIQVWGPGKVSLALANLTEWGIDLKDGGRHQAQVTYDGVVMTIAVDGFRVIEGLIVTMGSALDESGNAWVGFGGRTGSAWSDHVLHDWSYSSNEIPAPGPIALGAMGIGLMAVSRRRRS